MILAEALAERKATVAKINELREQISGSVVLPEDEASDEARAEVQEAKGELEDAIRRLTTLVVVINEANNRAQITFRDETTSVMRAIALRDEFMLAHKTKQAILSEMEDKLERGSGGRRGRLYGYGERRKKDDIKVEALIDLGAMRGEVNQAAESVRLLDVEIQKVNWSFEIE